MFRTYWRRRGREAQGRAVPRGRSPYVRRCRAAVLGSLLIWRAGSAQGQDSVRLSQAGADAARSRREAAATADYYNLKLGPTAWRFGAELGLEVNDNIQLEPVHARADLIFRPGINTRMLWPVTDVNSLNLTVGTGYSAYVQHSQFDRFYIIPGSELSFDLYSGDFWINLHDRFSMTENNYQDPTVVGSADYTLLQNALGETTTWDLNRALIRFGYDHVNYSTLLGANENQTGQPDGESEVFSASAGYHLTPAMLTGLELGGSLLTYSDSGTNQFFSDASSWNMGAFVEGQISQYLRGNASFGYTVYTPKASGPIGTTDFQGVYAQIELSHRLNRYVDYSLTCGRTVNFAFYGGTVDLAFMRWQARWNLIRQCTLTTSWDFEHGSQLGFEGETFNRYGPGLSLGRAITQKLTASFAYQLYWRESDLPGRDYRDNIVTLNGRYEF